MPGCGAASARNLWILHLACGEDRAGDGTKAKAPRNDRQAAQHLQQPVSSTLTNSESLAQAS